MKISAFTAGQFTCSPMEMFYKWFESFKHKLLNDLSLVDVRVELENVENTKFRWSVFLNPTVTGQCMIIVTVYNG